MKIIRGLTEGNHIVHAAVQPDGSARLLEGNLYDASRLTDRVVTVKKVLAPVEPAMIWCVGLNYKRHAQETGGRVPAEPIIFAKGPNALQHPGDPIELPRVAASDEVDYECELAVVIGRRCKNVSTGAALDYVLGYTCANDVSARDWQITRGGSQWCRGKTFDTFAPLGPALVTADEIPDPQGLRVRTILNGDTMQDSNTNDMIFAVADVVSFLSGSTTLSPGTVILTGTPEGVGMARTPPRWLRVGDQVTIAIDRIGELTNPVVLEP
ncbi:MAG: 5-carboxymethyl-2-hydroxymuconate isomerase [Luteitalea sp.]|nr:5-carboxymethyl-2-hydroxymuconate isomerase [Luteitalea sp.]